MPLIDWAPTAWGTYVVEAVAPPRLIDACVHLVDIRESKWPPENVESTAITLLIGKENIVNTAEALGVVVRGCSLPNDLVDEVLRAKHGVHQHPQVWAGRGIAVKID